MSQPILDGFNHQYEKCMSLVWCYSFFFYAGISAENQYIADLNCLYRRKTEYISFESVELIPTATKYFLQNFFPILKWRFGKDIVTLWKGHRSELKWFQIRAGMPDINNKISIASTPLQINYCYCIRARIYNMSHVARSVKASRTCSRPSVAVRS